MNGPQSTLSGYRLLSRLRPVSVLRTRLTGFCPREPLTRDLIGTATYRGPVRYSDTAYYIMGCRVNEKGTRRCLFSWVYGAEEDRRKRNKLLFINVCVSLSFVYAPIVAPFPYVLTLLVAYRHSNVSAVAHDK